MSREHSPASHGRGEVRPGSDPILSFRQCWENLGLSKRTFQRQVQPYLETVQVSPQRRGVRQSVLERFKDSRSLPAARSAAAPQK